MQKQETGWCAQRCGARARQERCPGASCRENSPQGLGVQETPSLGWKGRGHRALQLRDTPILAYPFLSRGLGQVGAPPGSGVPLSCQGAKAALTPAGQSQPTLGPRGPLGGRWPTLPRLPWEQQIKDSRAIEPC